MCLVLVVTKMSNGKELAEALTDALNGSSVRTVADDFAAELEHTHPTLQQSFWRFVQVVARLYSTSDGHTDGRNELSREFTKRLTELVANGDWRLPFI